MSLPWDEWIPGVLNKRQMKTLLEDGYITSSGPEPTLDHSSMDLTLSNEAYRMTKGSVKPSEDQSYDWFISKKTKLAEPFPGSGGEFRLEARTTYVFKLRERLESGLRGSGIHGQATAKSSVGRVDVLARLIVDGMMTYERFDPKGLEGGSGDMYLEITPITFPVKVKPGISLSQLRFFYGSPKDVRIKGPELFRTIFPGTATPDESLSVDLTEAVIGDPKGTACKGSAFCADSSPDQVDAVPLWSVTEKPDPCKHWRVVQADEAKRLHIEPDKFYILRSKEKIWLPSGIAVYCRASDETIGEMRIHYAGFVHPYFGLFRDDGSKGTPLIFEVRGHQVKVSLADKEKMANLIFYRMSEDALPPTEEEKHDTYGNQNLQLSKFFANWPKELKRNENGTIEAIR
jgi:dCTP deaminase